MPALKLLDKVRTELRSKHYSIKTEKAYTNWIKRFVFFHNKRHPNEMGAEEIKSFINNLATDHHVSSATQNQALQGILFLYKNILNKNVGWIEEIKFTHRKKHLPVVLSKEEVKKIFENLEGIALMISKLLYGAGLRLGECLSLRVKDVDLDLMTISVRDGKGEKDRITVLPDKLVTDF
ncbi:MAG: phage integrase N-terminal SAM-like domain-containing protein, partial [Ignavibacteriaceae bacterium]|nr:phage integrase N-terminal SAM-like domain-containing protein [Ignavibacteriaceae bacterium]